MTLRETRNAYLAGELPKADYIAAMHASHARLSDYAEFLSQTDIAEIRISDGQVVATTRTDGIRLICPRADMRSAPVEMLNFGSYEGPHGRLMLEFIPCGAVVFDVGANAGWYSLLIAKCFPDATVHAFEPIPDTFGLLAENVALNGLPNVRLHDFGLSERTGELTFYYEPDYSVRASAADLSADGSARKVTCAVCRMDALFPDLGDKVDFIKCDCEGAELLVFEGGRETLAAHRPVVFTEMLRKWTARFHYHPDRIIELFDSLGYACFAVAGEMLLSFTAMTESTTETNFFFLHREAHQTLIDKWGATTGADHG